MEEPIDTKETLRGKLSEYSELVLAIDKNPTNLIFWERVIDLARSEEGTEKAKGGFYGRIPLDEMIAIAQRLKSAKNTEEKYKILSERSSTRDFWYDIVLGHVNDKSLAVLGEQLGKRRWERALDVGSGTGNSLIELKKHAQSIVGLDRLSFLLDVARSRPELSGLELVTAEGLELPFKKESFDLVVAAGMTYYLKKDELPMFAAEVARVLKSGGSYAQTFVYGPEEGETLPFVEREYLESGKALLAYLMDRLISHQEEEPRPSSFTILAREFEDQGFERKVFEYPKKGVLVLEFRKPLSQDAEVLRRVYFVGDTYGATEAAYDLLYKEAGFSLEARGEIEEDKMPTTEELVGSLREFMKLAADEEVMHAEPVTDYFAVFIAPLVNVSISKVVNPKIRELTAGVLVENLGLLRSQLAGVENKKNWEIKGIIKRLRDLKEELGGKRECESVITQIDTIISENSIS